MLTVKQLVSRLEGQPDDLPVLIQLQSGIMIATQAVAIDAADLGAGEQPVITVIAMPASGAQVEAPNGHLPEEEDDDE